MELKLPVQAVVDRSVLLDVYLLSRTVQGTVVKDPVDGPYGALPGDPVWFSPMVDPRLRACEMFPGYGNGWCLSGGGYF